MFKRIFSDAVVYGSARVLMMGVSVFLVPIYSRHFSLGDYGVIETFNLFINLVLLIIPSGIAQSMFRLVYTIKTKEEQSVFYSTILHYYLMLALVFASIAILFSGFFTDALIQDRQYQKIFIAACLTIVFQLLNSYNQDLLRSQFEKWKYLVLSVGTVIFLASGGIYTVLVLGMGVKGFFYVAAFTHCLFFLLGFLINYKWFSLKFSKKNLNELIRLGLPFIPAGLSLALMKFLDRIVVQRVMGDGHLSGLDYLGLYAMAIKVSVLFDIISQAFSSAWFPWAMKIATEEDAKEQYRGLFLKVLLALTFAVFCFALVSKEILHILVDSKFWACLPMIPILLFGTLLNTSNYVIGSGIYASGKTKYISIPPIVGGLVNLLFCWLFAVYFGLVGVAFSVVMGSFAYLSTSYFISQKHYPINYSIGKGFLVLTTLIGFMFAIHWVDSLSVQINYIELGLKIVLLLVAVVLVFLSRVYSFGEIENALNKFVFSKLKRK
jgi:O-antigen/teichoic acid export membrane protein